VKWDRSATKLPLYWLVGGRHRLPRPNAPRWDVPPTLCVERVQLTPPSTTHPFLPLPYCIWTSFCDINTPVTSRRFALPDRFLPDENVCHWLRQCPHAEYQPVLDDRSRQDFGPLTLRTMQDNKKTSVSSVTSGVTYSAFEFNNHASAGNRTPITAQNPSPGPRGAAPKRPLGVFWACPPTSRKKYVGVARPPSPNDTGPPKAWPSLNARGSQSRIGLNQFPKPRTLHGLP
jgi:hypothetical protein